ncbi:tetratricopeptide repeat protein [Terriglobus aquaticus]|uniref:Tetratricopeptide repeat protein n=1 Tax=Terriglobus aquaticus TaxID=940139 RepID=A0ABW9KRV8_9BACT|nr:tetratricopeptide repeat protein [Terriglobus aquaticus]
MPALRTSIDAKRRTLQWACAIVFAVAHALVPHSASAQARTAASPAQARGSAAQQQTEREADAAREHGDTQASLKLYEAALAHRPQWQQGWWYYGSLLYDANRYADAARAFRKLTKLNDQLGDAWGMLGLCEFEVREYPAAYQDLQRTQRLSITEPSLQKIVDYHLALLLNVHGDADAALVLLSSLYVGGVRSEDLQVAMGLSLLRVPIFPADLDPSRDALVHDAGNLAALLATRQYEKAALSFQDMFARYPTVPFLHYAYGGMLASQARDADAEAQFKAETELSPDSVYPYLEWAFVAMKTKDYAESKRLANLALQRNANSFLAHYILGNSMLLSDDPKSAVPELELAKKLAPQMPDIRYSLSRAYARLGQADLARQEQADFRELQKKNAVDRLQLVKRYPGAQPITGVRPTTTQ